MYQAVFKKGLTKPESRQNFHLFLKQYLFAIGLYRLLKGRIQTTECELKVNLKLEFYLYIEVSLYAGEKNSQCDNSINIPWNSI